MNSFLEVSGVLFWAVVIALATLFCWNGFDYYFQQRNFKANMNAGPPYPYDMYSKPKRNRE